MIEIIRTGSQLCIVDLGRYKYRRYGVPISGAMDIRSGVRANSLLHNTLNVALLEMYMPGHQLLFHQNTRIALTGAESELYLNDKRIYTDQVYSVARKSKLTVGAMSRGSRIYLAVQDGFQSSIILGSRSPIPGYLNRTLTRGDRLEYNNVAHSTRLSSSISALKIDNTQQIYCHQGPEWHLFHHKSQKALLSKVYKIDIKSDRMGYRLQGSKTKCKIKSIYSSAVMPGTVQFLPDGLPLILMRDCQTTGGYPRIFQIIEEDINQLAQRRPGDEVQFQLIQGSIENERPIP